MKEPYRTTIQYTVKLEGFRYHSRKGLLKKGSTISKSTHPVREVEILKEKLLEKRALVDKGNFYECKHDVKTGLLMAYNLHSGKLEKNIPEAIVSINGAEDEDNHIKDVLRHQSFYSADNEFRINIDRDAFKLDRIMHIEYNDSFFKGKGDGSLSGAEQFVVDVLRNAQEISDYRRGEPNDRECDLVDATNNRQIEIVSYLDEKIPAKLRYSSKEMKQQSLAFEYCNFGNSIVSEGVIKKFSEKEYTDKYEKELAIYMIGSGSEARNKIKALEQKVRALVVEGKIKNDYKKLHFVIHDPFESGNIYYISNDKSKLLNDSDCSASPVVAKEVAINDVLDEEYYYVTKKCIFNPGMTSAALMTGADLKHYRII